jgi:hypothetical protein
MKLIDLIDYFRSEGNFDKFCKNNDLSSESEVIEIYAERPVTLNSQLGFFPIEETQGRIEIRIGGKAYRNLFSFFYFLDAIDEAKQMKHIGNEELAEKLFSYAINDA